jgi:B12-binding domain/radical SAM domain protein
MMTGPTTLILLDTKANRHSLNALVGALETAPDLDEVELRLASGEPQLDASINAVLSAGRRPIVGASFTTPQLWRMQDVMGRLRGRFKGTPVLWIAGGPHPTADPEGTLRLGFDIVVRGEGEATLLDLLRTIIAGGDWGDVLGIAFRNAAGAMQLTGRRPSIDLNGFPPFPLRRRRVVGPIEITRGCPFACAFCQTSHLAGVQPRHRNIETICRYAGVIRQRGLRDVRVLTPNAFSYGSPDGKTLNLPALESLLSALRQTLGQEGRLYFGSFPSEVRPEHVTDATLQLITRYANNDNLVIGAQSGSPEVLKHCGRGHTVADVFSAVARSVAAGLTPHVDFIFGLPGETPDDMKRTIQVIRELVAIGALIHAHTFMPLPQTRFAHQPPGRIHGRLRSIIREMVHDGTLHGVWHRQEREAKRIAEYLRNDEHSAF